MDAYRAVIFYVYINRIYKTDFKPNDTITKTTMPVSKSNNDGFKKL